MSKQKSIFIMLFLCVITVFNSRLVMAESYQFELNGGYFHIKSDDVKIADYSINAVINFKEVSLDSGPYEEAAFLQKTGYFGFAGDMGKTEIGDGEINALNFAADLKYVLPAIPLFIKVSYERNNNDGDFEDAGFLYEFESTENIFGGELGYYIIDGLTVAAAYERGKDVTDYASPLEDTETTNTIYGANFKYVAILNDQMGINIAGSYKNQTAKTTFDFSSSEEEKNKIYNVRADFYITPKIGIGGEAEFNRGDDKFSEGNTYKADFKIYFTPNIGLSAGYGVFKPEDTGLTPEEKLYMAELTARI